MQDQDHSTKEFSGKGILLLPGNGRSWFQGRIFSQKHARSTISLLALKLPEDECLQEGNENGTYECQLTWSCSLRGDRRASTDIVRSGGDFVSLRTPSKSRQCRPMLKFTPQKIVTGSRAADIIRVCFTSVAKSATTLEQCSLVFGTAAIKNITFSEDMRFRNIDRRSYESKNKRSWRDGRLMNRPKKQRRQLGLQSHLIGRWLPRRSRGASNEIRVSNTPAKPQQRQLKNIAEVGAGDSWIAI